MTRILDNAIVNQAQAKYIELRKGILINGQYYLKENMQPVPFNQVTLNIKNMGTHRKLIVDKSINYADAFEDHHSYNCCNSNIHFDESDENVTFILVNNAIYTNLIRFEEKDNKCMQTHCIELSNTISMQALGIYEKDEVLYVGVKNTASAQTLNLYNKLDLNFIRSINSEATGNQNYRHGHASKLTNNLYYQSACAFMSYSYYSEKQNKALMMKWGSTPSTSNYLQLAHNDLLEETNEYIDVINFTANAMATHSFLKIMQIARFNKETELWSNVYITIDYSKDPDFKDNEYYTTSTFNSDTFIRTIDNRTFVFVYYRCNVASNSKIMTYEIIKEESEVDGTIVINTKVERIKTQHFPEGQCGKIIYNGKNEKLKFYGHCSENVRSLMTSIYSYELNEETLEFEKTMSIEGQFYEFGFDKERNLFVVNSDYSVDKYNTRTVSNFEAKFETELYEYIGEDIETNLIITTKNLQGDLLKKEVKLDIKGNAKFKATDNKTIIVSTSDTEEIKVPVIITGAGSLNVFPKIKA